MAQKIVGLDIGSHAIKAAILESTFRGWELIGFHETPLAAEAQASALGAMAASPAKPETEKPEDAIEEKKDTSEDAEESGEPGRETVIEADAPSPLSQAIQDFIQRYGADWDAIYTALDGDTLSIKQLSFPYTDNRQIDSTLAFSLEDLVPFDLSDKLTDFQVVHREAARSDVLTGILDRKRMQRYLGLFELTGKQPRGVTLDSLALVNLFEQTGMATEDGAPLGLIDIGHRKTTIAIFVANELAFSRTIPAGSVALTRALAKEFEVDLPSAENLKHLEGFVRSQAVQIENERQERIAKTLEKALEPMLRQIRLTFQGFTAKTKKSVASVRILGGGSKLTYLDLYLSETLGIPVEPLHYLKSNFNRLPDSDEVEALMAPALGIALSGVSGSRMKRLNFRKGDFAFKGDFEYWKSRISYAAVCLGVIVCFFIVNLWSQFHVIGAQESKMTESIQKTCKTILGKETNDAKICLSQMMEVIGKESTSGIKMKPEVGALTLYDELVSRLTADETVVDLDELEISDKKIKLRGRVDSIATAAAITENVKKYTCFSNASQGKTGPSAIEPTKTEFNLSIPVECSTKKKGPDKADKAEKGADKPADKGDKTEKAQEKEAEEE